MSTKLPKSVRRAPAVARAPGPQTLCNIEQRLSGLYKQRSSTPSNCIAASASRSLARASEQEYGNSVSELPRELTSEHALIPRKLGAQLKSNCVRNSTVYCIECTVNIFPRITSVDFASSGAGCVCVGQTARKMCTSISFKTLTLPRVTVTRCRRYFSDLEHFLVIFSRTLDYMRDVQ